MQRCVIAFSMASLLWGGTQLGAQDMKPNWPIPQAIKWEAVNGYPMSYREAGTGTPMVLVHGSVNDYRAWNAQFDAFSASHRVIAVSLRHFYPERWDGSGSDFSIEQHAQDVAALIKKLNLDRVHLVGHSRGGAVVIEVAKSHPEIIRTLVLPDASIEMPVEESAEARQAAEFTKTLIGTLQNNLKTETPPKAAEVFVDMLSAPGAWPKLPEPVREMILANIYTALGEKGRPLTSCDDVRKFDFPILLMTGEKSPKKFELFYNEMRKCKSFPTTVIIPNAAHAMQRMNPGFFNNVTLEFVSKH